MDPDQSSAFLSGERFQSLQRLDEVLRCEICKLFMQGAVSLAECGHSFCSECIRGYISACKADPCCPVCKKKVQTSSIQANSVLQAAIQHYIASRSLIVELVRSSAPESRTIASARASTRQTGKRARDDTEDEVVEIVSAPSVAASRAAGGPTSASSALPSRPDPPPRLPSKNYHMLKAAQLKDLCASVGLRADGDADTLRYRHESYTTSYNAAVDSIPRYEYNPTAHCEAVRALAQGGAQRKKILADTEKKVQAWLQDKSGRAAIARAQPSLFHFQTSGSSEGSSAGTSIGAGYAGSSSSSALASAGAVPLNQMAVVTPAMQAHFKELRRTLLEEHAKRKAQRAQENRANSSAGMGAGGHAAASAGHTSAGRSAVIAPLPATCHAVWSETCNRPFFFDSEKGIGSWEHPAGTEATAAWQSMGREHGRLASDASSLAHVSGQSNIAQRVVRTRAGSEGSASSSGAGHTSAAGAAHSNSMQGIAQERRAAGPEDVPSDAPTAASPAASRRSKRQKGPAVHVHAAVQAEGGGTAAGAPSDSSAATRAEQGLSSSATAAAAATLPAGSSTSGQPASGGWLCARCTFENKPRAVKCAACHSGRSM